VDKLPNQRGLLVIFLAEPGEMRLHDSEEFRHHRRNTSEVMRPGCSFPSTSDHRNGHDGLKICGVHASGSGLKTDIHSFLSA